MANPSSITTTPANGRPRPGAAPSKLQVEILPWEEFLLWWVPTWEQGDHLGIIGPTKTGKSTLSYGLCAHRDYVMALDAKGGDRTLTATGWQRVTKFPLPVGVISDIKDSQPARLIIGKPARTKVARAANRLLIAQYVDAVFEQGRWTVIAGEMQLLTDRRFLNIADSFVELLIAARDAAISVVAELQRVSIGASTGGASSTVGDQVYWLAITYTRDDRMLQRLAELLGRPADECRELITALPEHCWAIVGRDPRAPFIVTKPPKVSVPAIAHQPPKVTWRDKLWGSIKH